MGRELNFTVDQFREDPEVWNILDRDGQVVAQEDSKADAEGLALVYDSIFLKGATFKDSELASLRERVARYIKALDDKTDGKAKTWLEVNMALDQLREALRNAK